MEWSVLFKTICLQKSPHFEKKSSENPPSYGRYPTFPTSTTETWPKTSFSAFSSAANSTEATKTLEYRPKFTRIHGLWIVANRPVRPASNEVDINEEEPPEVYNVTIETATEPKTKADLTMTGVALKINEIKDEETQMISADEKFQKQSDSDFGANQNFGLVEKPGSEKLISMTSGVSGNFFPNYSSVLLIFIKLTH